MDTSQQQQLRQHPSATLGPAAVAVFSGQAPTGGSSDYTSAPPSYHISGGGNAAAVAGGSGHVARDPLSYGVQSQVQKAQVGSLTSNGGSGGGGGEVLYAHQSSNGQGVLHPHLGDEGLDGTAGMQATTSPGGGGLRRSAVASLKKTKREMSMKKDKQQ